LVVPAISTPQRTVRGQQRASRVNTSSLQKQQAASRAPHTHTPPPPNTQPPPSSSRPPSSYPRPPHPHPLFPCSCKYRRMQGGSRRGRYCPHCAVCPHTPRRYTASCRQYRPKGVPVVVRHQALDRVPNVRQTWYHRVLGKAVARDKGLGCTHAKAKPRRHVGAQRASRRMQVCKVCAVLSPKAPSFPPSSFPPPPFLPSSFPPLTPTYPQFVNRPVANLMAKLVPLPIFFSIPSYSNQPYPNSPILFHSPTLSRLCSCQAYGKRPKYKGKKAGQ
jgi:hypothetical protein